MNKILLLLIIPVILSAGVYFFKPVSQDNLPVKVVAESREVHKSHEHSKEKNEAEAGLKKDKDRVKTKRTIRTIEIPGSDNKYFEVYEQEIEKQLWQVVLQTVSKDASNTEFRNIVISCPSATFIELAKWHGLMSEEPPSKIEKIQSINTQGTVENKLYMLLCKK